MVTQTKKPSAIFPDFPRDKKIAKENGEISDSWSLSLNNVYQSLQKNFSNEGIVFPPLSSTDIATIQAIYTPLIGNPLPQNTPDISGKSVFDSTNRVPKQFIITYDGSTPPNIVTAAWKTFTLT